MYFFNGKKVFLIITILTGVFTYIACLGYSSLTSDQIVINEVCSNNFTLMKDENERYSDYIELYNPGLEDVSLAGYFLSDDADQLQKYFLDPIVIPPKGYYVIWLDGTDDVAAERIGFRVSKSGEEIFLSNGEEIIDSIVVPNLSYNTSFGRVNDGEKEWERMTATVGGSNNAAEILPSVELGDPVFSVPSGFYDKAFQLTITASENEIIYYTLDGSDPTPDSNRYQPPIEIDDASRQDNVYAARTDLSPTRDYVPSFKVDKATIVRAVSYNIQENTASKIVSKVYFVGYDQREEYDDLPIISIVSDPDNLFDMETGIYGNGMELERYKAEGGLKDGVLLESFTDETGKERYYYQASNAFKDGKEWEREATITYFDNDHKYGFTQDVGIQIAGQTSRGTPKKSLNIYGRDIYDENVIFPYEIFPGTDYSTIKLRNGGSNNDGAVITDAFLQELAEDRNVSIQRSKPCIVFLNGEYWGIYNIRERYKEEYLSNHYGVNENNVWIVDPGYSEVGRNEAEVGYIYMIDVLTECDLSFDDVYAMVCEIIDVQSLIDYCCINLYVDNRDVSFKQNTVLWRTVESGETEIEDGRWRWMLYDLDISIHDDSNSLPITWMKDHDLMNEPAIKSLMSNEQFRKQFCITFMDIANTTYTYDIVHNKLMEWKETYKTQMVKSHQRFFDADFTRVEYDNYIEDMDTFFRQRFPFAMASLAEEFGLTGSLETVTVKNNIPEAGTVMVNTALTDKSGEWSGTYFTDYPISLKATPKEGYRFVGWSGDVSEQETQIEVSIPKGGLTVWAVFEKID